MRIAVLCVGNELLMDEGVGPACARYLLSRYEFPENVDVLDRAVMGMGVMSDLRDHDFMLAIDALEVPGARPGQIFSFAPEDAAPTPPGMLSLHEVRFADVLASAGLLGIGCDGHCLGIQVENMSPSEFVVALTPRVAAALPLLAQAAVRYLRGELGLEVRDLLAERDERKAGSGNVGARGFSPEGSDGGAAATEAPGGADVALPAVYGEPDRSVMTHYLAQGLSAVGARAVAEDGGSGVVEFALPGSDGRCGAAGGVPTAEGRPTAEGVAGRFGLVALGCGGEGSEDSGWARFAAYVTPATTDYDCDALIGACLDVVERGK